MYFPNSLVLLLGSLPVSTTARSKPALNNLAVRDASRIRVCAADAISPPPPKLKCNFEGVLTKPQPTIDVLTVDSLTQCRDACMLESRCKLFSWEPSTNTCKLYPKSALSQKSRKRPSGIYYYHRKCFNDPTFYDPMPLVNAGFETGKLEPDWITMQTSYDTTSPPISATVDPRTDGNSLHALLLEVGPLSSDGYQGGNVKVSQTFQLCQNVTYDFGLSFQVSNFGTVNWYTEFIAGLRTTDGSLFGTATTTWAADGKWFNVGTRRYTARDTGPIMFETFVDIQGAGSDGGQVSVAFDNLYFVARDYAGAPPFPVCASGLLQNSDFETGDLTGWHTAAKPSTGTYRTEVVHPDFQEGTNKAARMSIYGSPGPDNSYSTLVQQVQVCAGQRYDFSFDYYVVNSSPGGNSPATLGVDVETVEGYHPIQTFLPLAADEGGQWRSVTFSVLFQSTAPAQIAFTLNLPAGKQAAPLDLYIDNVKFTEHEA